jgi:hypothetical protein
MASLTPKQKRQLVQVSNWGHLFHVYYDMGFLVDKGLVCKPTAGEIEAHYTGLALDQRDKKRELVEALMADQFDLVGGLLTHCQANYIELRDRAEDQDRLVVLSPAGIAMLEKITAVKQQ